MLPSLQSGLKTIVPASYGAPRYRALRALSERIEREGVPAIPGLTARHVSNIMALVLSPVVPVREKTKGDLRDAYYFLRGVADDVKRLTPILERSQVIERVEGANGKTWRVKLAKDNASS